MSSGGGVVVGEGVSVDNLTMPVGVSIEVGIVGAAAEGIVGLAGTHPAKAKAGIKKRENKASSFMVGTFPIVLLF